MDDVRHEITHTVQAIGDFFVSTYGDFAFIQKKIGKDERAGMDEAEAIAIYHLGGAKALNEAMWVAMTQAMISGDTT